MDPNKKKQYLISQTTEACSNMIVEISQLRLSILDLFTTLADGGPDPRRSQTGIATANHFNPGHKSIGYNNQAQNHSHHHQQASESHTHCTAANPSIKAQRQQEQLQYNDLIQYVGQTISNITSIVRALDQDITILIQNHTYINPGESIHLGLDSALDKHTLYIDLYKSYKTFTKLHDYSAHCHALLLQQSLKRVHKRFDSMTPSGASMTTTGNLTLSQQLQQQQQRPEPAVFNPYIYRICQSRHSVQTMLETCLKVCEFMEGTYSQPFGSSIGVFQITVNRVLKAILVMRGIVIDAVIVKAHHESFARKATTNKADSLALLASCGNATTTTTTGGTTVSGSQFVDADDDIDLWSESKYNVFRRLTHHANAAVLHFQYPTYPEIAVRSFLSWFNSYADLFSATCSRCNSRLRKFMPPICRDFSSGFHPHHDSCK